MNTPDIKELCEELRPIIGNRANQLYIQFLLADNSKEKEEIRQQIELMHHKNINKNEVNTKEIILPPPAPREAKGEFPIGKVIFNNRELYEFGINKNELQQHTLIMGRSGAGKTTLLKAFIGGFLLKKLPFMIFDNKKEFRSIFKILPKDNLEWYTLGSKISPLNFNLIKKPENIELDEWIQVLSDLICQIFFISYGGRSILREGLQSIFKENENPKLTDLKEWLDSKKQYGRSGLWTQSMQRAIDCLCYGNTGKSFNSNNELNINDVINKNVFFEVDNVGAEIRAFFTSYIMLRISINAKTQNNTKLKNVIIFDEGHRIFKNQKEVDIGERITETICRELRSFGTGLIISTQHPYKLSLEAYGNTFTKICLNLNIEKEINTACGSILLHGEKKDYVNRLKVGQAIIKLSDRINEPFLIQILDLSSNGIDSADDRLIHDFMQSKELFKQTNSIDSTDNKIQKGLPDNTKDSRLIQESDKLENKKNDRINRINEEQIIFLKTLIKYPLMNVTSLYQKMGFCNATGNKIKLELINNGIIKPVNIKQKHGKIILLEITDYGRNIIRNQLKINLSINKRKGGLEHQYWIKKITEHYKNKGYTVYNEYPVGNGKTVDVVAIDKNGKKIAIEVETGKSSGKRNINVINKLLGN